MAAASDAGIAILRQKQQFAMPAIRYAVVNNQLLDGILRAGVIINDYFADIDIATPALTRCPGPLPLETGPV
jgi:hypothetical protein